MFREKLRLRFVGWKLIVPRVEQSLVRTKSWVGGNTYKLDDCLRSAKVGETCKPGTTVCPVTETEAIAISQKRYGT